MIFVDEARIFVKGGNGGKGCESFYQDRLNRYPRPDGGDGGAGGDVYCVADKSVQTLLDFKFQQHHKAKSGGHGGSKGKTGRGGAACTLRVPCGTIIRDSESKLLIRDMVNDGDSVIVAKGGRGGIGNKHKKTPEPPELGEERWLHLELKLIADVGIIGFPNAGKSTFISNICKVKSKIANYPFTTKQPILGFVSGDEFDGSSTLRTGFVIADLPGIIEGAHQGRGLGDKFLRHAERTKVLLHMIDMAGTENRDPLEDFEKINHEINEYSDGLRVKEKILVANKMDLPEAAENLKRFKAKYKENIHTISSLEKQGTDELVEVLRKKLCHESFQEK